MHHAPPCPRRACAVGVAWRGRGCCDIWLNNGVLCVYMSEGWLIEWSRGWAEMEGMTVNEYQISVPASDDIHRNVVELLDPTSCSYYHLTSYWFHLFLIIKPFISNPLVGQLGAAVGANTRPSCNASLFPPAAPRQTLGGSQRRIGDPQRTWYKSIYDLVFSWGDRTRLELPVSK